MSSQGISWWRSAAAIVVGGSVVLGGALELYAQGRGGGRGGPSAGARGGGGGGPARAPSISRGGGAPAPSVSRGQAIRGPQATVRGPQATVRGPQATVRGPQTTIRGPQTTVRGPQVAPSLRGPTEAIRQAPGQLQQQVAPAQRALREVPGRAIEQTQRVAPQPRGPDRAPGVQPGRAAEAIRGQLDGVGRGVEGIGRGVGPTVRDTTRGLGETVRDLPGQPTAPGRALREGIGREGIVPGRPDVGPRARDVAEPLREGLRDVPGDVRGRLRDTRDRVIDTERIRDRVDRDLRDLRGIDRFNQLDTVWVGRDGRRWDFYAERRWFNDRWWFWHPLHGWWYWRWWPAYGMFWPWYHYGGFYAPIYAGAPVYVETQTVAYDQPVLGAYLADSPQGVYIQAVVPGGPADRADMRAGDILVSIEQRPIYTKGEVLHLIAHYRPGDTVHIEVAGTDGNLMIPVTLGRRADVY